MPTRTALVILAMLAVATAAHAQVAQAPGTPAADETVWPDFTNVNFVDVGFRGTLYTEGSDQARHQRYRDLDNGLLADAFRYSKDTAVRWFAVDGQHVGGRDQRYRASFNQFGRLKASVDWNQIPLFFSEDTVTLYSSPMNGTLRIDDPIQAGIENTSTTLAGVAGQAVPFDMRLDRHVANVNAVFEATPNMDVRVTVRDTTKKGSQPWAGGFGFSNAVELAAPVDTRTTELGTALEWGNQRGSVRVGYDGSFFRNDTDTLVWDNPLRISDSPSSGPHQGRMSLWPDSTMNAGSALGTINLPGRSRVTGYVSVADWSQNEALVPFTINTALPTFSPDRATAETSALVTAVHSTFTSRPTNALSVVLRYRSYDFDNRTPVFHVTDTVSYDTSVSTFSEGGTSPYSLDRKTVDAELTYSPFTHASFRAGYTHENIDQTFRYTDSTGENFLRLSADLVGPSWLTLRGVYEHSKRVGEGFDDTVLDDIGEQTSLRQFDISDRRFDRFSAIAVVMPTASLSFNGQATVGDDDRSDEGFGVLNGFTRMYSLGVDYAPGQAITMGASYTYERFGTLQRSRQANPGPEFDDPRRDWMTDARERADTVSAGIDMIKLWPRTDIRVGYDFSRGDSRYLYELAPDSTLPPVTQLPSVTNTLNRATTDVRYYLTRHTAVGVVYWFDKYDGDDFATSPETLNSIAMPSFLTLGYTTRPYTANTFVGRVSYFW